MNDNNASIIEAQKLLEQLAKGYIAELPAQIERLESEILALKSGENQVEAYQTLYRSVHSLKGTAGTYGLNIISTICHQFEDYLPIAFDQHGMARNSDNFNQCLAYADLLAETTRLIQAGGTNFTTVEQTLSQFKKTSLEERYTGLIVESSRALAELYLKLLEDLPVRFSIVRSGTEALNRLVHERFDILISGLQVRELNGQALIAAMRLSQGINSGTPALLVSSSEVATLPGMEPDAIVRRNDDFADNLHNQVKKLLQI